MPPITEYRLQFCTVTLREDDIVIIEIDDGVNLDAEMANELVELSNKELGDRPFALLSNRINSYSFSFEALSKLANIPNLIALAIVIYSDKSQLLVEAQNFFLSTIRKRPIKIFRRKDEAMNWLGKELDKVTAINTFN